MAKENYVYKWRDDYDMPDDGERLMAYFKSEGVQYEFIGSEYGKALIRFAMKLSERDMEWVEAHVQDIESLIKRPLRLIKSGEDVLILDPQLPFHEKRFVSYHDIIFDVFYGFGKAETGDMSLPVIFGKMSNGGIVTRNLARLPHLLIGGLTASGKSVFLHSLICSLVQNHSPEQVRFVMMDPKRVEFEAYAKLPHLYASIVHEPEQGVSTLKDVEFEIERRLVFFGWKGCRSIADFYKSNAEARMPYLVVVVDELSDFIVGSDGAFESTASRIAAIGRSAGVHLVMATSRLDANIIPEGLKANIPGRLAFKVGRKADSRTLLDEYGAEELLGRGDALLKDCNGTTVRLQVPYISDDGIARIVDSAIARHPGRHVTGWIAPAAAEREDCKSMYARALNLVRTTRRASITWLQRQLNIGYNDAAHVMSLLEERGMIGPANDKGQREILIEDS